MSTPYRKVSNDNRKWIVLLLASSTSMLVFAIPFVSLPVLFSEIASELDLSVVQIGLVWGAGSLTGVIAGIPAGSLGDRFGPRRTLAFACAAMGITGAMRGLAVNYATFMLSALLFGLFAPAIAPNVHKTAGTWFPNRRGFAAGVVSSGFATGLMLGSAISASILSPLLGGWRSVLFLYGGVSVLFSFLWLLLYPSRTSAAISARHTQASLDALRYVARKRELWLLGLGTLFFWACVRGTVGYLPTYLRDLGIRPVLADQALALYYGVSLAAVLPFSYFSDRLYTKRTFIVIGCLATSVGVGILTFARGHLIWMAIVSAGLFFDAYMAQHQAAVLDIDGIGGIYGGVALGLLSTLREVGGTLGPAIGNTFTLFTPGAPFAFWSALALGGVFILLRLPRRRRIRAVQRMDAS